MQARKKKPADYELYNAALDGDLAEVKRLITKGADVNPKMPLSILAAKNDAKDAIEARIKKGENPNAISPLCIATEYGHHKVMRALLERGANVKQLSPYGIAMEKQNFNTYALYNKSKSQLSAMHIAAAKGDITAMELLLNHGASVNYAAIGTVYVSMNIFPWRCHSCTPLHAAVNSGKLEAVKFLLDRGADIDQPSFDKVVGPYETKGLTPLHYAASLGLDEIVTLLVNRGAKINKIGYTQGASTNLEGGSALYFAAKHGHASTVALLLSRGADPCISGDPLVSNRSPLHIAARHGYVTVISKLLNAGVNVDQINGLPPARSPLSYAVENSQLDAAKFLSAQGAHVTEKMIRIARDRGDDSMLRCLEHAYKIQQMCKSLKITAPTGLCKKALEKIRSVAHVDDSNDTKALDNAIATFTQIVRLDNSARSVDVCHVLNPIYRPVSQRMVTDLTTHAYECFIRNPQDTKIVADMIEGANCVKNSAKDAHTRLSIFGSHTRCDLEKAIEKAVRPKI